MIVDADLVSLETAVRDHIGEETARTFGAAGVRRAINAEYAKLVRLAIRADQGYFETSKTYTMASTQTLALPVWCSKIRNFEAKRDGSWYPISPLGSHRLYQFLRDSSITHEAYGVRFEGNNLVIEPGISNISQLRIHYNRVPAPLITGTATAGAASTITAESTASNHDDIYIGDTIVTTGGTGSDQTREVSDYDGGTKVITVSTDFDTTPDATTVYATALAHPIDHYPELVAVGAAFRLMPQRRDTETMGALSGWYQTELAAFEGQIAERQSSEPRYVHFIDDGMEDY